jgi:hypothetical protein
MGFLVGRRPVPEVLGCTTFADRVFSLAPTSHGNGEAGVLHTRQAEDPALKDLAERRAFHPRD